MNRSLASLAFSALVVASIVVGCATAAPAPTQTPPTPTKAPAAQPTAVPTAAAKPTAAPAAKAGWPEKGKAISVIVPFAAGGTTDLAARILASFMEKDLGTPLQVVNKAGASSQTGLTEFVKSKPDGYTIAYFMMQYPISFYLDPQRQAAFTKKDFKLIGMVGEDPKMVIVKAESPYKTMKDLVEAARAQPEKITFASGGLLSPEDIWVKQLERATGVRFASVQFDGIAAMTTALLGGHVEFALGSVGSVGSALKANQVRLLAQAAPKANPLAPPDVQTIKAQGYEVYAMLSRAIAVPAGTPDNVADIIGKSIQRAMQDPDQKKKIGEIQMDFSYMGPEQLSAYWDQTEKEMAPVIAGVKP